MPHNYTLREFSALQTSCRFAVLEDVGVYLEVSRMYRGNKVALFALFNFYVEVWLDIDSGKVTRASPFDAYEKLDRYVDQISLSALLDLL